MWEVWRTVATRFRQWLDEETDDDEEVYGHPRHNLWLGEWS